VLARFCSLHRFVRIPHCELLSSRKNCRRRKTPISDSGSPGRTSAQLLRIALLENDFNLIAVLPPDSLRGNVLAQLDRYDHRRR
jgi:hypothetical protein